MAFPTDTAAILANTEKIQEAKSEWENNEEKDRAAWISIYAPLLRDLCGHNAAAPSGDPEDSDVPECPAT